MKASPAPRLGAHRLTYDLSWYSTDAAATSIPEFWAWSAIARGVPVVHVRCCCQRRDCMPLNLHPRMPGPGIT